MVDSSPALRDEFTGYIKSFVREPEAAFQVSHWIRMNEESIQVAPEQGAMLAFLVAATGAQRVLEVGTHVGYSAIWICSALAHLRPPGELLTLELHTQRADQARLFLKAAGYSSIAQVVEMDAREALPGLQSESFDMAFVDSEKIHYFDVVKLTLERLRTGGLLVVDNTLHKGRVLNPEKANTRTIATLNEFLLSGDIGPGVLIPLGDGFTAVVKS
jgi:predicted O-methyltransferase YrrM